MIFIPAEIDESPSIVIIRHLITNFFLSQGCCGLNCFSQFSKHGLGLWWGLGNVIIDILKSHFYDCTSRCGNVDTESIVDKLFVVDIDSAHYPHLGRSWAAY